MPVHNFTISDLTGSLAAICLFPLVVFIPGYVLAWLLDLLRFRRRTLLFRAAFSIPLSISLCPILTYLTARFSSMTLVWVLYGALWLGFAAILVTARLPALRVPGKLPWLLAGGWTFVALLSLIDLQFGHRLYYSTIALDYAVRSAFTNAITVTGIPPQNPFSRTGPTVLLRYHYFWLILCSLVQRMGDPLISARQALIGGTVWAGFGLMSLVTLYLRLFAPAGSACLRRRSTIGILLLGVTGLGIVPTLLLLLGHVKGAVAFVFPSLEWWNEQVDGWIYSILWEPHHISGLIACLTAFLLLWYVAEQPGRRGVAQNGVVAGVALASAIGASIYVAFVFALFLAVWTVITIWRKWRRETAALLVAGTVCAVCALPYLRALRGPGGGGPLLELTVRAFLIPDMIIRAAGFGAWWQLAIGNLVLLPLNYYLELGFFFAVFWLYRKNWRARGYKLTRQELASIAMLATSVLICTFVRSSVIDNNDLGWRGFLIAQFVLLLWGADLLSDWRAHISPRQRARLAVLIVLGGAGTLYDLAILRSYSLLSDRGAVPVLSWMTNDRQLGARTYAAREAYTWVRAHTPATAVVQQNPGVGIQDTDARLYSGRAAVAADLRCGAEFGGDPRSCAPIVAELQRLYSPAADFEGVCRDLRIDVVVARDVDSVWSDKRSWAWQRKPVFANDYLRLFACPVRGPGESAFSAFLTSSRVQ